jgi:hypothetical protein
MIAGPIRVGVEAMLAMEEQAQDRGGSLVPAGPGERCVASGVAGGQIGAGIDQRLNCSRGGEGGGAMKRRFALCPAIAHEAAGWRACPCRRVRVRAGGEKQPDDMLVVQPAGVAAGGVERRLGTVGQRRASVGPLLDQELAEPPVAVEGGTIEIKIVAQRSQRFAMREQMPDGADIAIISAPADQRGAGIVGGAGIAACIDPVERGRCVRRRSARSSRGPQSGAHWARSQSRSAPPSCGPITVTTSA